MPYNIGEESGGDSPKNDAWMEKCIQSVMSKGNIKDKGRAVAICKAQLKKNKGDHAKAEYDIGLILERGLLDLVK